MKKIAFALTLMAITASTPPEISIIVNTVSFADALAASPAVVAPQAKTTQRTQANAYAAPAKIACQPKNFFCFSPKTCVTAAKTKLSPVVVTTPCVATK